MRNLQAILDKCLSTMKELCEEIQRHGQINGEEGEQETTDLLDNSLGQQHETQTGLNFAGIILKKN